MYVNQKRAIFYGIIIRQAQYILNTEVRNLMDKNVFYDFEYILSTLPPLCRASICKIQKSYCIEDKFITEIRLRYRRNTCICVGKRTYMTDYKISDEDIRSVISRFCEGSVYSFSETIKNGYIPARGGIRVGVVGELIGDGYDVSIESIRSVNIRIPHHIRGVCAQVYDLFIKNRSGIIIYSPPAVGKTTLLRDLAIELSRGRFAHKVALVDTRRELDNGLIPSDCQIDTYFGYPKSVAIEIAIRTMSSEVVMCDELGKDEVEAIKRCAYCGVPVICAVHANCLAELYKKSGISELLSTSVFSHAVGLSRDDMQKHFDFEITVIDKEADIYV